MELVTIHLLRGFLSLTIFEGNLFLSYKNMHENKRRHLCLFLGFLTNFIFFSNNCIIFNNNNKKSFNIVDPFGFLHFQKKVKSSVNSLVGHPTPCDKGGEGLAS